MKFSRPFIVRRRFLCAGLAALGVTTGAALADLEYLVVDLGTLGGVRSEATGINDRSQAVGWTLDANGRTNAFLWQNGSLTGLGFLSNASNSVATAINNNGEITGYSYVSPTNCHAFIIVSNSMTNIGTLGGPSSWARAVNDRRDVAGSAQLASNSPANTDPEIFVWRTNQLLNIHPYNDQYSSDACGINQEGRICGNTFLWSPNPRWWAYVWFDSNTNFLNDAGEMKLLGALAPKNSTGEYSLAMDVNDIGQAVGWTGITNTIYPRHAFLVTSSGGQWKIPDSNINPTNSLMRDLGGLGSPTNNSYANAINNQSWIVGTSEMPSGTNQAFLWRNGVMTNLNLLVASNSGWVLTDAVGINEFNEIVGTGLFHGQRRAFMLRQGGRIASVEPIIVQTGYWVYTNEFDEIVTQTVEHVETQVLQWAGIWGTNAGASHVYTLEYCDALQTHNWTPFYPTSQWPVAANIWTNADFGAVSMRFFRVRAQEP